MKLFCFILCITYTSGFLTDLELSVKDRIVGGLPLRSNKVTYQASVHDGEKLLGGAAIIASNWLLTAEKLFKDVVHPSNLLVRVGTIYNADTTFSNVRKIHKYSDSFPISDLDTNLALILVDYLRSGRGFEKPIPIEKSNINPTPGSFMTVAGYGKIHNTFPAATALLRTATVKVAESKDCAEASARLFCAGDPENDVCTLDEGGPGVIDGKLVAIITGTPNCAAEEVPSVYTKVGAFYRWIVATTGLEF